VNSVAPESAWQKEEKNGGALLVEFSNKRERVK